MIALGKVFFLGIHGSSCLLPIDKKIQQGEFYVDFFEGIVTYLTAIDIFNTWS